MVPTPTRNPAGQRTDPDQQLPAGGPRHMKASPGPGPHTWATRRLVTIAGRLNERWLNRRPSPSPN
ncbi:hypothetical protein FDW83_16905 [Pseudarthrobacter sp. NamE2]|uniref:hypothetical protein n=1 Tax=Pseudarthrobacter sp. NamE2 TaxID=2576838 RepID=UPI0012789838|nr:hypothetical protein [Pseudarthrobacter sp. NamE2]TLM81316.1 hypothetical protein FDW83_16905 [Pseudarthrobacter sp. NamE2]